MGSPTSGPHVESEVEFSHGAFDSFGVLEHIFSFLEATSLLSASLVNKRWKEAGRSDELWKAMTRRLWASKKGVYASGKHPLFWRSLFSKDTVARLSVAQIRAIFDHPLLEKKKKLLQQCIEKAELRRFLQVHMLDVMSDGDSRQHFFRNIYFGSYACSVHDSKRTTISQEELCTANGFDMYFKIVDDDIEEDERNFLHMHDGNENILLYHHSTCFFDDSRDFRMVVEDHIDDYHPTELQWRWVDKGTKVQVGPYPPLAITRKDDWGWRLENVHVVLLFRDARLSQSRKL